MSLATVALLNGYKDKVRVLRLVQSISKIAESMPLTSLMHVCGTHEHEISRYGIRQLLPKNIRIVPGPGCPVCICPVAAIDEAITLCYQPGITLLSFGDMVRVPATQQSLAEARSNGGSVKIIYSPLDAIKFANQSPSENVVFFSIGFETTAAGVAGLIASGVPKNLFFLVANRYMPPVLDLLMEINDNSIHGFLLAGHAAAITGIHAYDFMVDEYQLPCVVSGFEPVDILLGILHLLQLIKAGDARVVNAYPRVVRDAGNTVAMALLDKVFVRQPGIWRGIDMVADSAFCLRPCYQHCDAKLHFSCTPTYPAMEHPPGCLCHRIILGELEPTACKLFKTTCSPSRPYGPCMVSAEGTCRTRFRYGADDQTKLQLGVKF